MKIIVAHNFYQQAGGEDQVFDAEVALLKRFGHDVHAFVRRNDQVEAMGKLRALAATIWNRESYRAMREMVEQTGATIVHFHNTLPLISPAAYQGAHDGGAAVVQTLHNFRLICPNALLYREGSPCEKCVGRSIAWPGVIHKCYRGSASASAAVAAMTAVHRAIGTYDKRVDAYIAISPSARKKVIEGGLPADRILLKPNFVDPDPRRGLSSGGYASFVGRLSQEKGLETLIDAWDRLGGSVPLKIVGDGPLAPLVKSAVERHSNIEWLGRRNLDEVYEVIGNAAVHIFPSRCYETFGRVAVEAFAKGVPVIASRHGSMADLVDHGRTGLLFEPGNGVELAESVKQILGNEAERRVMCDAARAEYESRYTGDANHAMLMNVYAKARATFAGNGNTAPAIVVAATKS
jgi:glycosyltransferase involved in cell wall biosynthesis